MGGQHENYMKLQPLPGMKEVVHWLSRRLGRAPAEMHRRSASRIDGLRDLYLRNPEEAERRVNRLTMIAYFNDVVTWRVVSVAWVLYTTIRSYLPLKKDAADAPVDAPVSVDSRSVRSIYTRGFLCLLAAGTSACILQAFASGRDETNLVGSMQALFGQA
jgi:hypothetical protein